MGLRVGGVEDADLIVLVVDVHSGLSEATEEIIAGLQESSTKPQTVRFRVTPPAETTEGRSPHREPTQLAGTARA